MVGCVGEFIGVRCGGSELGELAVIVLRIVRKRSIVCLSLLSFLRLGHSRLFGCATSLSASRRYRVSLPHFVLDF